MRQPRLPGAISDDTGAKKAIWIYRLREQVVDDAYAGKAYAAEILDYMAEHLASALINSIHLPDLDAIVLYGELNYRSKRLLEHLREALEQRSVLFRSHPIALFPSKITPATADIASASRILDEYFQQKLEEKRQD